MESWSYHTQLPRLEGQRRTAVFYCFSVPDPDGVRFSLCCEGWVFHAVVRSSTVFLTCSVDLVSVCDRLRFENIP